MYQPKEFFQMMLPLQYLNITYVAHKLQCNIQAVISWTIINILKIPSVDYLILITPSK